MSRTLFLDIDGVLMAHTQQPPKLKTTGFDDWRKVDKPRPFGWAGWISDEQRALILDVFGHLDDRIVWLTTWEISGYTPGGANGAFSDYIQWAHHHCFNEEWLEAGFNFATESRGSWWKQDIMNRALVDRHDFVDCDEIVWVDDELRGQRSLMCQDILNTYLSERSAYTLVCPDPAWSRDSIESFRKEPGQRA